MKTAIYFFSATGNSLHTAREVAKSLPVAEVRSVVPLLADDGAIPCDADVVGFSFPIHWGGLPLPVEDFARRLAVKPGAYVFALVTCGSPHFGRPLRDLRAILRAKGADLAYGEYVRMVSNDAKLNDIPQSKLDARLPAANAALARIGADLAARRRRLSFEWGGAVLGPVHRAWKARIASIDRDFSAGPGCVGCGLCAKICPQRNVALESGRPAWRHRCCECFACFHACPQKAIEKGSKTQGRRRYRHPAVPLADLLAANAPAGNPRP